MKVFLFNRSNVQGHQDTISVGDLCIIQTDDYVAFAFVKEDFFSHLEKGYILANELVMHRLNCDSYGIIYSFDGVSRRSGDFEVLRSLQDISHSAWAAFFRELCNILSYKEDRIDINVYCGLIKEPVASICIPIITGPSGVQPAANSASTDVPEQPEQPEQPKNDDETLKKSPLLPPASYLFYSCLDDKGKAFWNDCYKEVHSIRELYILLKKSHRSSFSKALKQFDAEHPNESIYKTNIDLHN